MRSLRIIFPSLMIYGFLNLFPFASIAIEVDGSYDTSSIDTSKPIPGYIYDLAHQVVPKLEFSEKTDALIIGFTHAPPSGVPESLTNQVISLKKEGFTDLILELAYNSDNCPDLFRMSQGLFPLDPINYPNIGGIGGQPALTMIKTFMDNGFRVTCGDLENIIENGIQFHKRNLRFAHQIMELKAANRVPILLIGNAHPPAIEAILKDLDKHLQIRIYDATQTSGTPPCRGIPFPDLNNSCKVDPNWPGNKKLLF